MTDAEVIEIVKNTLFDVLEEKKKNEIWGCEQVDHAYVRDSAGIHETITSWVLHMEGMNSKILDYIARSIRSVLGDEYGVIGFKLSVPEDSGFYATRIPIRFQVFVYRKENN